MEDITKKEAVTSEEMQAEAPEQTERTTPENPRSALEEALDRAFYESAVDEKADEEFRNLTEKFEEGDIIYYDVVDPSERASSVLSEEELRELQQLTLVDAEGREHEFMLLANLVVEEHQYLILEPAEGGEAGHYMILPYELSQNEDALIDFRDFYDEAEYEAAAAAAEEMFAAEHQEF